MGKCRAVAVGALPPEKEKASLRHPYPHQVNSMVRDRPNSRVGAIKGVVSNVGRPHNNGNTHFPNQLGFFLLKSNSCSSKNLYRRSRAVIDSRRVNASSRPLVPRMVYICREVVCRILHLMSGRGGQRDGVRKHEGLSATNISSWSLSARNSPAVAVKIAVRIVPSGDLQVHAPVITRSGMLHNGASEVKSNSLHRPYPHRAPALDSPC